MWYTVYEKNIERSFKVNKNKIYFIVAVISFMLLFVGCNGNSFNNKNEFDTAFTTASNEEITAESTEETKPDISALLESVQKGKTYAEVVAVLGESGPDIGSGLCIYKWTLPDGSVWRGAFKPQGKGNIPPEDWVLFNFDLVEDH